jgi:hypothetical protein
MFTARTTTVENNMEVSLKSKNRFSIPLAIPLLKIYLKECDSGYHGTCTPMCIAALFTIAKLWKQPRCPSIDKYIKKM